MLGVFCPPATMGLKLAIAVLVAGGCRKVFCIVITRAVSLGPFEWVGYRSLLVVVVICEAVLVFWGGGFFERKGVCKELLN